MNAVSACLVVLAAAACMAAPANVKATKWTPPVSYETEAIISLPYADISEPTHVYFDGVASRSRIEYYLGLDVYIYRPDLYTFGSLFQLVPEITTRSCVQTNGTSDAPTAAQGLLPDLSTFELAPQPDYHRGVLCDVYLYNFTQGGKVNTYEFYVAQATQSPISFHFVGYDQLYGSHYDEYDINYVSWNPTPKFTPGLFEPPTDLVCGDFPGPGAQEHNSRSVAAEVTDIPAYHTKAEARFESFVTKHGKTYRHAADKAFRKSIFHAHERFVDTHNHKGLSFKLAINHMADWNKDEFKAIRGVRSSKVQSAAKPVTALNVNDFPSDFDLRPTGAIGVVKDQGICGSCWSFASAEALEGAWFLKNKKAGFSGALEPMSQQALMDCSWNHGNNACDGGEASRAYDWVLENGGIPTEASYGLYLMADGLCHPQAATKGAVLASYLNLTSGDANALQGALFNNGPVAVAIDAGHMEFVFYSSGVYYLPSCRNDPDGLDHAVLAVGWGVEAGQGYWLIKNSWSQNWGDEGFVKMATQDNNCGVTTDANLPLV